MFKSCFEQSLPYVKDRRRVGTKKYPTNVKCSQKSNNKENLPRILKPHPKKVHLWFSTSVMYSPKPKLNNSSVLYFIPISSPRLKTTNNFASLDIKHIWSKHIFPEIFDVTHLVSLSKLKLETQSPGETHLNDLKWHFFLQNTTHMF